MLALLAPAIERLQPLTRQSLLELLALSDGRLCRAVGVTDIHETLRRARAIRAARDVPTALRPRVDATLGADAGASDTSARGAPGAICRAARGEDSRAPSRRADATRETSAGVTPARGAPGAICRHDPAYPVALAQLDSAPAVLYTTCEPERLGELLAAPVVALLGERTHSGYAHEVTFALARDLAAAGVTIVSGLHQGIDGIAHHGALHTGGRTIAVTGSAPEIPHPRQLDHLHRCILLKGAAISELPPGFSPPRPWCFLASQRIIAALANVVVVVEAGERSSTLLAAQVAADLGRDVAVVPGRVTDPGGQGTSALLRDGAHPVGSAQDVLDLIHGAGAGRMAA
ncbi:MAG TPA: DNA-processing protein DprA [Solirubrobacteraceae bacterium]|nr:DNA-processing protein DprA [Solirubrobacteraceae bacterium]